jgi:UDP-N-acetylglucosamine acyltransferase
MASSSDLIASWEDDAVIGDGCILEAYVVVKRYTQLGCFNRIYPGAVLGGEPQDQKVQGRAEFPSSSATATSSASMSPSIGATGEDQATIIGNDNLIMAYCHIGHNCRLGDQISIASYSGVSGHAVIESFVTTRRDDGHPSIRDRRQIGDDRGMSKVVQDVPPFMLADGRPAKVVGLNVVGLRRAMIPPEVRETLHEAYRLLYRANLNTSQALEQIEAELPPNEELRYLVDFIRRVSQGYLGRQRNAPQVTLSPPCR